jgi:hypothetical protein
VPLEASPRLNFSAGALGIARGEDPDSGGPEFFVMDYATSHLWGNFTVWGQVVEGLDVVRAIARVQAVAAPPQAPPEVRGAMPFDRMAVQPPRILAATNEAQLLERAVAAGLPARVGLNVRDGDLRHSLEWPADLAPGRASELTWYLRPYNDTAAPEPSGLALRVAGPGGEASPALRPEEGYPEVLRWSWTPPAPGAHRATLLRGSAELAAIDVLVPGP